MTTAALYCVTTGQAGLYMPDSNSGPIMLGTRREFAAYIRYEIEAQGFPKSVFRQAKVRRRWAIIQSARSSSVAHFSIEHDGREIAFHGLTTDEFQQMDSEE